MNAVSKQPSPAAIPLKQGQVAPSPRQEVASKAGQAKMPVDSFQKSGEPQKPLTPKQEREKVLREALIKAAQYRAEHPETVKLGMGDHSFWANPASYQKFSNPGFWRNPDSYRGHGR